MISKLYKALCGLLLTFQYTKVFDTALFRGKRIAIIGAASSAYNTGKGEYIDNFDHVIRINKATLLLKDGNGKHDIGTKADILFHSFFENMHSGGGPLDFNLFDQLGIQYVINPIPGYFGYRVIFNFFKKYLLRRTVFIMPSHTYKTVEQRFGRFRATTGFCALKAAMESDFSELYIAGFTFFKTAYADGYRDSMKQAEAARKYISDSDIHNPDLEYEEFKLLLSANQHKNIIIDQTLLDILANDGFRFITKHSG